VFIISNKVKFLIKKGAKNRAEGGER